jgi:hypothetical protein
MAADTLEAEGQRRKRVGNSVWTTGHNSKKGTISRETYRVPEGGNL